MCCVRFAFNPIEVFVQKSEYRICTAWICWQSSFVRVFCGQPFIFFSVERMMNVELNEFQFCWLLSLLPIAGKLPVRTDPPLPGFRNRWMTRGERGKEKGHIVKSTHAHTLRSSRTHGNLINKTFKCTFYYRAKCAAFSRRQSSGHVTFTGQEVALRAPMYFIDSCLDSLHNSHRMWESMHAIREKNYDIKHLQIIAARVCLDILDMIWPYTRSTGKIT